MEQRNLVGYTPRDLKELDTAEHMTENLAFAFITCLPHIFCIYSLSNVSLFCSTFYFYSYSCSSTIAIFLLSCKNGPWIVILTSFLVASYQLIPYITFRGSSLVARPIRSLPAMWGDLQMTQDFDYGLGGRSLEEKGNGRSFQYSELLNKAKQSKMKFLKKAWVGLDQWPARNFVVSLFPQNPTLYIHNNVLTLLLSYSAQIHSHYTTALL